MALPCRIRIVSAAGTGDIHYWDKERKKEHRLWVGGRDGDPRPGRISFKDFEKRQEAEAFLDETFGFKYPDDLVPDRSTENRQIVNMYFYKQLEDHINNLEEEQSDSPATP